MTEKDAASELYQTLRARAARKIRAAMGFDEPSSGVEFQNISQDGVKEKWSTA
jgi:hypothetical protein